MSLALALDFGTASTRVATDAGELVLDEPTVAAVDAESGRLLAFGREALGLGARSGGRVTLARPVQAGRIVDVDLAEQVLAAALRSCGAGRFSAVRVLACAHLGATEVHRRAVGKALKKAGVRNISFVEQPVVCAIGAGLDIAEPVGAMVVDLGAGVCDVAVIALGGLVSASPVELGGDAFDEALRAHLARRHHVIVDLSAASTLRAREASIGSPPPGELEVEGRDAATGQHCIVEVPRAELCGVLERAAQPIFDAAERCIAGAPPDLANDLLRVGLVLAGGGARIAGLDHHLARVTGVPVHVPERGELLSVFGAAQCLGGDLGAAPRFSSAAAR